jgi:hypothetical protein
MIDRFWVVVILFLVFSAFVIVIELAKFRKAQRRRKCVLEELSQEMGFTFDHQDSTFAQRLPVMDVSLFRPVNNRDFYNIMSGHIDDVDVLCFDMAHRTGDGIESYVVMMCMIDGIVWPTFSLGYSCKTWAIFKKLGVDKKRIAFDEHPEFSNKILLESDSSEIVETIFNPHVREYVQDVFVPMHIHLQAFGSRLIAYQFDTSLSEENTDKETYRGMILAITGFVQLLAQTNRNLLKLTER